LLRCVSLLLALNVVFEATQPTPQIDLRQIADIIRDPGRTDQPSPAKSNE
jgi:hypothetical protein